MKKISIFLLICMLLGNIQTLTYAKTNENQYDTNMEWNVTPSEWAKSSVDRAIELDIISQNTFGYIYEIPRENFCDILYRMLYKSGKIDTSLMMTKKFKDIDKESINYFYNIGIINGFGQDEFKPLKSLTREEAAVILTRTIEKVGIPFDKLLIKNNKYNDDEIISEWAKEAVYAMYNSDIMIGDDDFNFNPQSRYTVEQSIVSILRVYDYIQK